VVLRRTVQGIGLVNVVGPVRVSVTAVLLSTFTVSWEPSPATMIKVPLEKGPPVWFVTRSKGVSML